MLPLIVLLVFGLGVSSGSWLESGLFEDQMKFFINLILLIVFCGFEWARIEFTKLKAEIKKVKEQLDDK